VKTDSQEGDCLEKQQKSCKLRSSQVRPTGVEKPTSYWLGFPSEQKMIWNSLLFLRPSLFDKKLKQWSNITILLHLCSLMYYQLQTTGTWFANESNSTTSWVVNCSSESLPVNASKKTGKVPRFLDKWLLEVGTFFFFSRQKKSELQDASDKWPQYLDSLINSRFFFLTKSQDNESQSARCLGQMTSLLGLGLNKNKYRYLYQCFSTNDLITWTGPNRYTFFLSVDSREEESKVLRFGKMATWTGSNQCTFAVNLKYVGLTV